MENLLKVLIIFLVLYALGWLSKKREQKIETAFKRITNLIKGTPEKNQVESSQNCKAKERTAAKNKLPEPDGFFRQTFNISEREWQVTQHICTGKSNKDIEKELFISLATVKDHIHNIYQKTGIKNRVQLVNLVRSHIDRV